ncbi:putative LYSR-type transcriptional regulator [Escherichia coli]|nr:putative LYSR-type transcriptional regulator [Escherichia coli]
MDIFISKKMRNFILLAQTNNIARAAEKNPYDGFAIW